MAPRKRLDLRPIITRGALAGLVGAIPIGLLLMLVSGNRTLGVWTPLQLIGATVLGEAWRTAAGAVVGLFLHLAVGAAVGVAFSALVGRRVTQRSTNGILGLLFAAIVFAPMTYGVLRLVNPVMFASQAIHTGVLFLAHLVYGLAMGLALGPLGRRPGAARPGEHIRSGYSPGTHG